MSTTEILTVIAVVVVITLLLTLLSISKQKKSWTGTLVKKEVNDDRQRTDDYRSLQTYYFLIFTTDAGKKIKVSVDKAMFDKFSVGCRVIKKSGANYPEILQ
jgi:hypothetical protein